MACCARLPSVAILALLAAAPALSAQVIRGNLLDAESDAPLNGGTVTLLDDERIHGPPVLTDSSGAFVLSASGAGSYRVRVERPDFVPGVSPVLILGARDTIEVEFRLSTRDVILDPVVVTARKRPSRFLAGFYDRVEQRVAGNFITRGEIEQKHPVRTTDLLRTLPGVQLAPSEMGGGSSIVFRGTCSPTIYIDGIRARMGFDSFNMDDLVSPRDLEGVEVYRSVSEAPAEYVGMEAGCGVILLWTKRGP